MSGAPSLHVVQADPTPPYEQLRRQLTALVAGGVLGPGARLPPVRQLAADLGLAPGTVARTYRELEQDGLVVSRRGAGTRVTAGAGAAGGTGHAEALLRSAARYVRDARSVGASDAQVRAALDAALREP